MLGIWGSGFFLRLEGCLRRAVLSITLGYSGKDCFKRREGPKGASVLTLGMVAV